MKTIQTIILICIFGILTTEQIYDESQLTNKQPQDDVIAYSSSSLTRNSNNNEMQFGTAGTSWRLNKLLNGDDHFNITYNNTACVMFDGDFTFSVTYRSEKSKINTAQVRVPKVMDSNVKIDGSCIASQGQWIEILWGDYLPKSSMKLSFNTSENVDSWVLLAIEAVIVLDEKIFVNATNSGESLQSIFYTSLNPYDVPFNRSYKCFSDILNVNSTTYLDNSHYPYPVYLNMESVQMQAYNQKSFTFQFAQAKYCQLDRDADLLPKVVGGILASVIIVILVAHFFCPRDSRHQYDRI